MSLGSPGWLASRKLQGPPSARTQASPCGLLEGVVPGRSLSCTTLAGSRASALRSAEPLPTQVAEVGKQWDFGTVRGRAVAC